MCLLYPTLLLVKNSKKACIRVIDKLRLISKMYSNQIRPQIIDSIKL